MRKVAKCKNLKYKDFCLEKTMQPKKDFKLSI